MQPVMPCNAIGIKSFLEILKNAEPTEVKSTNLIGRESVPSVLACPMSKLKQDVFDKAHEMALAATTRKRPTQRSYNDLDKVKITSRPTALQLLHMYKDIHNLFVKYSAALVPRNVCFAQPVGGIPSTFKEELLDGVPVAIPYDKQNLCFFIIEVVIDKDVVFQFPMRFDSMYCCGFRVLELGDDPLEKIWYSFGKVQILPNRLFKNRKKSGLSLDYNNFEGSRFWFAMCLSLEGVQCKTVYCVRLTDLMANLIQDYGDTSRLCVYLWLAFLEREMDSAATSLHDKSRFPDLFLAFRKEVEKFLKYAEADPGFNNRPLIKFKGSNDGYCLGALVGQSLFIIKYSCVLVRKALMREANYTRI